MSSEVTILNRPARYALAELAKRAAEPLRAAVAERAVVFGSYARGEADGYSDLDLAVVLQTDLPWPERARLMPGLAAAIPVPLDLLVFTPAEFARGMQERRDVFDAIAREGTEVYAQPEG